MAGENDERRCGEQPVPVLEDLVPLAAVIGAGCEPCAVRMVERALRRGAPEAAVARTLAILDEMCAAECFAAAVGPAIVDRMQRALQSGGSALERSGVSREASACRA